MSQAPITAVAIAAFLTVATLFPLVTSATESSSSGTETGIAACYNRRLKGHRTTSGQRYNPNALTAAHSSFPMGTHVKVTNIENGKSVVVLVNDHMSANARGGIIMDISQRACKELQFPKGGEAKVKLEVQTATSR